MTPTEPEIDYLATQPLGRLATRWPDASLQNDPVGFRHGHLTGTITGRSLGATRLA